MLVLRKFFQPMRKDYKKRLDMNLRQWLIYHQKTIVFDKCYWMGVRALKNPFDSWIYQEIIYEVKPEVIVEIGSYEGGSTLYLANLLDLLGKGQVISIDIDRTNFKVKHDRIIVITGDCSSQEVAGKVSQLCQGKRTLVLHDGDHSKNAVLRDFGHLFQTGQRWQLSDCRGWYSRPVQARRWYRAVIRRAA